jgi:hypothetical protein
VDGDLSTSPALSVLAKLVAGLTDAERAELVRLLGRGDGAQ